MNGLTLEDLSVGQEFETGSVLITAESIKAFARQFDPQPMHLDEEAARQGPFGRLTASGWQTLSLAMKLMADAKPLGETPLLGVGVTDIHFASPVYPDTTIYVVARVTNVRKSSKPGRGFVKMDLEIRDRASGEAVATETWTMLVPSAV